MRVSRTGERPDEESVVDTVELDELDSLRLFTGRLLEVINTSKEKESKCKSTD